MKILSFFQLVKFALTLGYPFSFLCRRGENS
uniref:Uncharacterized protein n=1 Tax=Rhizophora mucronata TaxID=61149 RepID=A0A2P2K8K2_RHIMU